VIQLTEDIVEVFNNRRFKIIEDLTVELRGVVSMVSLETELIFK